MKIGDLAFTPESLENYRQARLNHWSDPGRLVVDKPQLLIVEHVQPQPLRAFRDVIVRSFELSRVVVGAEVKDRNRIRFARALA